MRPSENFSFSIYPDKHMHQLLEIRAMLEPSQEYVMFFYLEVGTGSGLCRRLDRRDRTMKSEGAESAVTAETVDRKAHVKHRDRMASLCVGQALISFRCFNAGIERN